MSSFRCGDVIPGCPSVLTGTETEILAELAEHVRDEHGLVELPPELAEAARSKLRPG
jgi:predicted small metal-binding protein